MWRGHLHDDPSVSSLSVVVFHVVFHRLSLLQLLIPTNCSQLINTAVNMTRMPLSLNHFSADPVLDTRAVSCITSSTSPRNCGTGTSTMTSSVHSDMHSRKKSWIASSLSPCICGAGRQRSAMGFSTGFTGVICKASMISSSAAPSRAHPHCHLVLHVPCTWTRPFMKGDGESWTTLCHQRPVTRGVRSTPLVFNGDPKSRRNGGKRN